MVSGGDSDDAAEPDVDAEAEAEDQAPTTDDEDGLWDDEGDAPSRGVSPVAIVVGAVAVLVLIVVLIASGGSGSDDPSKDDSVTTADPAKTTTTKEPGPAWPAVVQGRPPAFGTLHDPITKVAGDAEPGVYVWNDYDGWHLWIVDPSGKAAAKGTITSDQPLKDASTAEAGKGTATVDGSNLTFDFSGVDAKAAGANFNLGFYATDVTVNLGGTDLRLFLGTEAKASPIPAVISKAVQSS